MNKEGRQTAFNLSLTEGESGPTTVLAYYGYEVDEGLTFANFASLYPDRLPFEPPDNWTAAEFIKTKSHLSNREKILSGKKIAGREQYKMNEVMEEAQSTLIETIHGLGIEISPLAFGIRGGDSVIDMIKKHTGNRYFFKTDVLGAYGSVNVHRLAEVIASYDSGHSSLEWSLALERFAFVDGGDGYGIAEGGAASPLLFNIYMLPLDEKLTEYATQYGMVYTRYQDDLVFSLSGKSNPDRAKLGLRMRQNIKYEIRRHGLEISSRKTIRKDLRQQGPIIITGVQLNGNGRYNLPTTHERNFQRHIKDLMKKMDEDSSFIPSEFEMKQVEGIYAWARQCRDSNNRSRGRLVRSIEIRTDDLHRLLKTTYVRRDRQLRIRTGRTDSQAKTEEDRVSGVVDRIMEDYPYL